AQGAFAKLNLGPVVQGFGLIGKGSFQAAAGIAQMGYGIAKLGLVAAVRGLQGVGSVVGSIARTAASAINQMGLFGAVLGGVAAMGALKLVKMAAALGEQADRARVQFGEFSAGVIDQSKIMATAFGISQKAFLAASSAFGAMFQGVGYSDAAAAQLSTHFVRLSGDVAS